MKGPTPITEEVGEKEESRAGQQEAAPDQRLPDDSEEQVLPDDSQEQVLPDVANEQIFPDMGSEQIPEPETCRR